MTRDALIKKVSASDADGLVKAQAIALIREQWQETRMIPMEELFEMCCRCTEITVESGRSKNRKRENVRARQLFTYYGENWYTLTAMSKYLGHRDHSTLVHHRDVALKMLKSNDDIFLFDLANLERVISGHPPIPSEPRQKPASRLASVTMVHDVKTDVYYSSVKHLSLTLGYQPNMNLSRINKRFNKRYYRTQINVSKLQEIEIAPPIN